MVMMHAAAIGKTRAKARDYSPVLKMAMM